MEPRRLPPDEYLYDARAKRQHRHGTSHRKNAMLPADLIAALRTRYAEPHRHYHTQGHIDALLKELRVTLVPVHDRDVVEAAIWFHDAIYDTRRQDNEARSAELAGTQLREAGWAAEQVASVERLILATADHTAVARVLDEEPDAALFLDLDLSILGARPSVYDAYAEGVRKEFDWVSDADYRAGRLRVLERFLAQSRLFRTDYYLERDIIACDNMQREQIALLRG
ncbi:N-methyl-D-aspartate receptor NMDAR2C subunit [Uliginosibacterium sp. H3]|uniref:N-methyl-D-aspartate receptor NMDAR2C subunit n=1 Tax=Uliginosibacterium silvisoli TaxID=3114758 RepID=A0ABU6K0H3_9RHOO|nr:N-methyl-D-aspartate receptor NMDAR2C subunit [Uliginosibacterium sp. H3]